VTNPVVPEDSFYAFSHSGGKGVSPKTAFWNWTNDVDTFNDADFHVVEGGYRDRKTKMVLPKQDRFGNAAISMPVVKYPIMGGHVVESTFNTSRGLGNRRHFGHQVSEFLNPTMPTITKNKLKKKRINKSITPVIKDGINHILGGYNTLRGSTVLKQEKFTSNTKTNRNKYGC
jgi:hypothetical protein